MDRNCFECGREAEPGKLLCAACRADRLLHDWQATYARVVMRYGADSPEAERLLADRPTDGD